MITETRNNSAYGGVFSKKHGHVNKEWRGVCYIEMDILCLVMVV